MVPVQSLSEYFLFHLGIRSDSQESWTNFTGRRTSNDCGSDRSGWKWIYRFSLIFIVGRSQDNS